MEAEEPAVEASFSKKAVSWYPNYKCPLKLQVHDRYPNINFEFLGPSSYSARAVFSTRYQRAVDLEDKISNVELNCDMPIIQVINQTLVDAHNA